MEDLLMGDIGRSANTIRQEWHRLREELQSYRACLIQLKGAVQYTDPKNVEIRTVEERLTRYRERYLGISAYLHVPEYYRFDDSRLSSFYRGTRLEHEFQIKQVVSYLRDLITRLNEIRHEIDQKYQRELNEYAQHRINTSFVWTMVMSFSTILIRITSGGEKGIGSGTTALSIIAIGLLMTSIIVDAFLYHDFNGTTAESRIQVVHSMSLLSFLGLIFSFLGYVVSVGLI